MRMKREKTVMDNPIKTILQPASILAGMIIGAGVFSLPFVFVQAGLSTGFFYLGFFGLIYILLYFLYADVIVRTPGDHRFVGYSKIYLGPIGFWSSLFIGLVQLILVLTVYLILAPSFSRLLISADLTYHFLFFWIIGSVTIFSNSKRLAFLEFLIVIGIAAIMALIFIFGLKGFLTSPISFGLLDISKFLAVGPILFALSGALAIPEMVNYFREAKIPLSFMKRALALGGAIPMIAYGAFVVGVIGLSGSVTEDAVSGLVGSVPQFFLILVGVLGFLALLSSYIIVGDNVRRIIEYDLHLPAWVGGAAAILLPPMLYIAGLQNFIGAVSFIGLFFLPLEAIFIIAIWLRADKISELPSVFVGRFTRACIPAMLLVFFISLFYAIIR